MNQKYVSQEHWYQEHKEEADAYRATWVKEDRLRFPEAYAAYDFKSRLKKYNKTVEWYRDTLIAQNGLCAICQHLSYHCEKHIALGIDHSHRCCNTQNKCCGLCVRGLLCRKCNILISYLEQFTEQTTQQAVPEPNTWLSKAMQYLMNT